MPEVFMPRLSDTMTEGVLSQWLKHEGDEVHRGDILAEIETDKATMDLEAYEDGILTKIVVAAGTTVPCLATPLRLPHVLRHCACECASAQSESTVGSTLRSASSSLIRSRRHSAPSLRDKERKRTCGPSPPLVSTAAVPNGQPDLVCLINVSFPFDPGSLSHWVNPTKALIQENH